MGKLHQCYDKGVCFLGQTGKSFSGNKDKSIFIDSKRSSIKDSRTNDIAAKAFTIRVFVKDCQELSGKGHCDRSRFFRVKLFSQQLGI